MSKSIVVVDYGFGNTLSVIRAFQYLGFHPELTADPEKIISASHLVLPGDGAFGDTMAQLSRRDLLTPIGAFISTGKSFLGICVGMQILATIGKEFGTYKGLNVIPGKVIKFSFTEQQKIKIPQIGWNRLRLASTKLSWQGTILTNIRQNEWVYFIHSFIFVPNNSSHNLCVSTYGKQEYCSVVQKENVVGCQFHPEKSGKVGLKILNSFLHDFNKN